jgi:hypothetical protein
VSGRRAVGLLLALALLLVPAACGEGDEEATDSRVAASVEQHLRYLDARSSAVVAIDLRYDGRNWAHLRAHASRGLRAYRAALPADERTEIPPNVTGALNLLVGYAGLSFDRDVRPLLDGYLVLGFTQRPVPPLPPDVQALRRKPPDELTIDEQNRISDAQLEQERAAEPLVAGVYRSGRGGLRRVVERLAEGERLKPLEGHEDVVTLDNVAIVGDDTLVFAESGDDDDDVAGLRRVIEAAEDGEGFASSRVADAERAAGLEDPFLLMAGDRTIARAWVDEPSLRRATEQVPWIGAIRSVAGAVRLDEGGADMAGAVSTDPRALSDDELPVAPAGELDLPRDDRAVTGASRDQSVTTTFLARTARALFADSDFARAVERAERDLGVRFEDEVLRQFSCPSLSRFDPVGERFAARSCVKDPERMRELLPRLSRHLPRILTTLQRLDAEGLVGLLLVAPDAPLTPSFAQVAQIAVDALGGRDDDEMLYEVTGLRRQLGELAQSGPDELVFGLIGDTFVVGSDRELAREAADLEGERLAEPAASAIRVPGRLLSDDLDPESPDARAFAEVVRELRVTASADRSALRVRGRLDLND